MAQEVRRMRMLADLAAVPVLAPLPIGARLVVDSDAEALGRLSYAAYLGTIDDEGESLEEHVAEMAATLSGRYGHVIGPASRLVLTAQQEVSAAVLVTTWDDLPFLAFCMTHPDAQRQGLCAALVAEAARSLQALGHRQVHLAVSRANPAVRLYTRLGFREVPPPRRG